MVYGGYELLKNELQPVTELMKIKKRVMLTETDTEIGNQRGQEYIKNHTKTLEVKPKEGETPSPDSKAKPKTEQVIEENDSGNLHDGSAQKTKPEVAPNSFKEKCSEIYRSQENGIGTEEYKRFEKYCTKEDPDND